MATPTEPTTPEPNARSGAAPGDAGELSFSRVLGNVPLETFLTRVYTAREIRDAGFLNRVTIQSFDWAR